MFETGVRGGRLVRGACVWLYPFVTPVAPLACRFCSVSVLWYALTSYCHLFLCIWLYLLVTPVAPVVCLFCSVSVLWYVFVYCTLTLLCVGLLYCAVSFVAPIVCVVALWHRVRCLFVCVCLIVWLYPLVTPVAPVVCPFLFFVSTSDVCRRSRRRFTACSTRITPTSEYPRLLDKIIESCPVSTLLQREGRGGGVGAVVLVLGPRLPHHRKTKTGRERSG